MRATTHMRIMLHTDDCFERWCWQDTATGILGHVDCKCPCHYLRRIVSRINNRLDKVQFDTVVTLWCFGVIAFIAWLALLAAGVKL